MSDDVLRDRDHAFRRGRSVGLDVGALQIAPMGDSQQIHGLARRSADGSWKGTVYSCFDNTRDPNKQAESYKQVREEALSRI